MVLEYTQESLGNAVLRLEAGDVSCAGSAWQHWLPLLWDSASMCSRQVNLSFQLITCIIWEADLLRKFTFLDKNYPSLCQIISSSHFGKAVIILFRVKLVICVHFSLSNSIRDFRELQMGENRLQCSQVCRTTVPKPPSSCSKRLTQGQQAGFPPRERVMIRTKDCFFPAFRVSLISPQWEGTIKAIWESAFYIYLFNLCLLST